LGLTIARLPLPPAPVKLSLARFQPREISHSHLARVSAQDGGEPDTGLVYESISTNY